jgi:hypothetical protein
VAARFPDMSKANIHDRGSIERVYPPEAYAADAAANQKQPANPYLQGVRLTVPPDETGVFEFGRAAQQVGEIAGAVFLAPYRPTEGDGAHDISQGYDGFIDKVLAALPRLREKADASPGPDDPRLRGPRQ